MTRLATNPLRIINVFVLSVVAFVLFAAERSLTQNIPVFLPPVTYSSGGNFNASVALGDVNGDGKLDIVVANSCVANCGTADGVSGFGVLLGNGDGTFQPAQVHSLVAGTATSVALADLNGDGKLDVLISITPVVGCFSEGGGGSVGVFMGNGDGTFQPQQTYKSGGLCASNLAVADLAVVDVNGDGKPDLLVANGCGSDQSFCGFSIHGVIGVLLGNGDGSFKSAQTYDSGGVAPRGITAADVNGDGKLDLLVANGGSEQSGGGNGNTVILFGNGDGTFQTPKLIESFSPAAAGLASLTVADLNGDGKLDMVETTCFSSTCAGGTGAVEVQLGNGDGTFQAPQIYNSGGFLPVMVALADVNLDGKLDAVVVDTGECTSCPNGGVSVLLGNGDGTFSVPARHFSSGGAESLSAALGDANGDGRLDIAVANAFTLCGPHCNTSAGAVGVLLNKTPSCTTPPAVTVEATPTSLWPPNGKMVSVTVSGAITGKTGCGVTGATYAVADEYGRVQPSGPVTVGAGGAYSFTVPLQASRLGGDLDGRLYTITVTATNNTGKSGSQAATVIVPHDQRH
jgi:uncharacterized protein (DUF2141 family)